MRNRLHLLWITTPDGRQKAWCIAHRKAEVLRLTGRFDESETIMKTYQL